MSEYWQLVNRVALWPVMGERQVEISGSDASRFVQLLPPRNMADCSVGQCKYILISNQDGGILGDPVVMRLDAQRYWLSTADCDLESWASGVTAHADLDVEIRDSEVSVIRVQGPRSRDLMVSLFGLTVGDLRYFRAMTVPFGSGFR